MSTTGLDAVQTAHAKAMVAVVAARGLSRQVAVILIETALVESNLRIYASRGVPDSLHHPYDVLAEGTGDHLSVGILQQQVPSWGTAADCMDPARSATKFIYGAGSNRGLLSNPNLPRGWGNYTTGQAAQAVQVSAFPDRYQAQEARAMAIVAALWPAQPTPDPEDDMKDYLVAYNKAQWVVRRDLSSRTGVHTGDTLKALSQTGQYITADWIDAATMAGIPVAH